MLVAVASRVTVSGEKGSAHMADVSMHLGHLLDARKWAKHTQRKDWTLVRVERYAGTGFFYRYTWHGPRGTRTFRVEFGTERSIAFLQRLRDGLQAYRVAFAEGMTHLDEDRVDEAMQEHGENFV